MKLFQIMIEMKNSMVFFENADTSDGVDKYVDEFDDNPKAKSIKVYRFNEETENYGLVHQRVKDDERRLVGFGRW